MFITNSNHMQFMNGNIPYMFDCTAYSTNLVNFLRVPSQLFWYFINKTAYADTWADTSLQIVLLKSSMVKMWNIFGYFPMWLSQLFWYFINTTALCDTWADTSLHLFLLKSSMIDLSNMCSSIEWSCSRCEERGVDDSN